MDETSNGRTPSRHVRITPLMVGVAIAAAGTIPFWAGAKGTVAWFGLVVFAGGLLTVGTASVADKRWSHYNSIKFHSPFFWVGAALVLAGVALEFLAKGSTRFVGIALFACGMATIIGVGIVASKRAHLTQF